MSRTRLLTLLLAGSLGLNVALAGVMTYRTFNPPDDLVRKRLEEWRAERASRGPSRWDEYHRRREEEPPRKSEADTTRRRGFDWPDRAQVRQLAELRKETEEDIQPLRERARTIHDRIFTELLREEPDPALLDSLAGQNSRIQHRIQRRLLHMILEDREILTPEQYEWSLKYLVPGALGSKGVRGPGSRSPRPPGPGR
ncbi:MAG: hypothetical protein R6W82_00165 [bacterium]